MKRIPLILAIVLLCAPYSFGQLRSHLPLSIRGQLNRNFPGWRFAQPNREVLDFFSDRFPKEDPCVISGDFDGNGRKDYALLIEHPNAIEPNKRFTHLVEVLAFLRKGRSYRRVRLESSSPANPEVYLNLKKKGEVGYEFSTAKRFKYPNDSISFSFFEKAGGTYIWKKTRFKYVIESD